MFKPVWRSFLLLNRRQKTIFLLIVGLRVVVHALDLLGLAAIGVLGSMLAGGLTNQNEAEFLGISVPVNDSRNFLWVSGAVAGFFLAKSIIGTALLRVTTLFLARVEASSASEVATFLFSGDISRVRSMSKGEIQWAVSSSSQIAFSTMLFAGSALVTESALFTTVFAAFLFVDVSTALIITAYFLILITLFQTSINQRLRRLGSRMAENSVRVNNSVLDMAAAFREVTVLQKRPFFLEKFRGARRRHALDFSLQRFVMGLPRFFVEAALMVGIAGLIFWQFARGTLSEGIVITGIFLAGGVRMMASMLPLQNAITDIRINGPQAARAQAVIAEARQALDVQGQRHGEQEVFQALASDAAGDGHGLAVTAKNLTYHYPDADQPAVQGVSFEIPGGDFVAFIGPSGAGKTTLADLILGLHTPTDGSVAVDGRAPEALRQAHPGLVSYVPQKPGMVSGTIAENVALGEDINVIDWDRIDEVLRQAGLWEAVQALPKGARTNLGEQTDSLSGGQLQRLGIARALYPKPRLLVLDEATSALDAETEASITQTLFTLRGEVTVVVIAHRLSTIQHADTVFVVEDGHISAAGTLSQVRKQVPLIEKYVQLLRISDEESSVASGSASQGNDDAT